MNKAINKIVSLLVVFFMLFSETGMLLKSGITYAMEQEDNIIDKNVYFDVYFGEKSHEISYDLDSDEAKLLINLSAREDGYLKNASIHFENESFDIIAEKVQNEKIEKIENNVITLKQIDKNEEITLELPIKIKSTDMIRPDMFSREFQTKLFGTYINTSAKEIEINGSVSNKLIWNVNASTTTNIKVQKYVPFNSNKNYGVLLQIKAIAKVDDNKLPVNNSKLTIQTPVIDGKVPTSVKVVANSIMSMSKEEEKLEFDEEDWSYDATSGIVQIETKNEPNENGEVTWYKDVSDEYDISFIYEGKEVYDFANQNGFHSDIKMSANVNVYGEEVKELEEKTVEGKIELDKKVKDIVDFNLICEEDKISKGQIYSNYEAQEKSEIAYHLQYIADIGYAEILDYIEFSQDNYDQFVTEDNKVALTTLRGNNYTKNKEVKVDAVTFHQILGEDGYIQILDENDKQLAVINKETEVKDENYVLDITNLNNNKLKIKTSKPLTEGKLVLDMTKVIEPEQDYSKKQMKSFSMLRSTAQASTQILESELDDEISLTEPVSKAKIEFKTDKDSVNLSTAVEHKNLQLRITLDTSDTSNALFQNPTFKIKFPKVMESIKINDVQLVNANNLKIVEQKESAEDDQGCYEIKLQGTQTDYTVGEVLKGTNIVISMDTTLDELSPSVIEQIVMIYTNEASTLYEQTTEDGKGLATTNINVIAEKGLISASGMSGYKENDTETVFTLKNDKNVKIIDINDGNKTLKLSGTIVNNYGNDISNVKVLGKLPVTGNEIVDGKNKLQNTMTATLESELKIANMKAEDVDIYYSTNGNATADTGNSANGWTKTPSDLKAVKSYMIVIKNSMKNASRLDFSYSVNVANCTEFSKSIYTQYMASFVNISEIGETSETKAGAILGITTGTGPKLNVKLKSNVSAGTKLQAGTIARFDVTVTNEGESDATGVILSIPVPEGTKMVEMNVGYYVYEDVLKDDKPIEVKEIVLGKIEPKKSVTKTFELQVLSEDEMFTNSSYQKEIDVTASVIATRINEPVSSSPYKLYRVRGDLALTLVPSVSQEAGLQKGYKMIYRTQIKNISNKDIENIKVYQEVPSGVKITQAYFEENKEKTDDKTSINGNKVEGTLSKIEKGKTIVFAYEIEIENFTGDITARLEATGNGIAKHYSNTVKHTVNSVNVSIVQRSDSPEYIKEGEKIKYTYTIKNNSKDIVPTLEFLNKIPDGLEFVQLRQGVSGQMQDTGENSRLNEVNAYIYGLNPNEEYIIELTLIAKVLPNKDTKKVVNYATLNINNQRTIESNKIENYIEYTGTMHGKPSQNGRYIITGTAWLDSNLNGARDEDEELLSGIEVMLIYKKNSGIVKDVDTKENKITKTDSNGIYRFDNLKVGEYAVVFLYDASRYDITKYKQKDVTESRNCDALETTINYKGERKRAGVTDTVKITNSNIRNIDIGLYVSEKFDLRLEKYIGKVTLTTPTIGTKTYEHNKNIAKVEVLGNNVGQSSMVIEYKIVVKNEGAIAGYAKKIVDYLPKDLSFNAELNKDWYQGKDGNLYNSSLADVEIKPGEQKELTLLISKKITQNTLGVINNNAEIYESYNELGLEDMDSTAGNKVQNEDDMSSADLVVSIVTGKIVAYTILSILTISMLAVGIYFIKKNILDTKNK